MNIFIPPLGTKLILEEPWTFGLYDENRNEKFIHALRTSGQKIPEKEVDEPWRWNLCIYLCDYTFPAGTILTVRRIYIRLGYPDFDSVTFTAQVPFTDPDRLAKGRFWAKLSNVNTMKAIILP